jgi:hypothetical protein
MKINPVFLSYLIHLENVWKRKICVCTSQFALLKMLPTVEVVKKPHFQIAVREIVNAHY